MPVKGKKYTHQHILQMLCIYQLKQTLSLSDVKALTGRSDVDFEACYQRYLEVKEYLRTLIPTAFELYSAVDLSDPNEALIFCLSLSAVSTYMQRLCQQIIDARAAEETTS